MLSLKRHLLTKLFGDDYLEFRALDDLLVLLSDSGLDRSALLSHAGTGSALSRSVVRFIDKLKSDGYIEEKGGVFEVTSAGRLFVGKGGYTEEFLSHKRGIASFYFSLIALLVSLFSAIVSFASD